MFTSKREFDARSYSTRPELLTGLIRNNRLPLQRYEKMTADASAEEALRFVQSHLSPATADNAGVKIPDGYTVPTTALSKEAFFDVRPDANNVIALYLLPFIEAPLAQYDTSTGILRVLQDPALGAQQSDGYDWLRTNGIYGFRQTFQSVTAYNPTALMYLQGNVVASLIPSQIDNHDLRDSASLTHRYARVIENLPLTAQECSASIRKPYIGQAKDGIYMVNRNFTNDWTMRMRDREWNKATMTSYPMSPLGVIGNAIITKNSLGFRSTGGAIQFASAVNAPSVVSSNLATDTTIAVTGMQGTGYGLGVMFFTGLTSETTLRLKLVHGYEFVMKPGSPYLLAQTAPLLDESWAFKAISMQMLNKSLIYPADANFWGAILSGLKTVLPYVIPLVQQALPKISEWLGGKRDALIAEQEKLKQQAAEKKRLVESLKTSTKVK